jgi:hypothetical protein
MAMAVGANPQEGGIKPPVNYILLSYNPQTNSYVAAPLDKYITNALNLLSKMMAGNKDGKKQPYANSIGDLLGSPSAQSYLSGKAGYMPLGQAQYGSSSNLGDKYSAGLEQKVTYH